MAAPLSLYIFGDQTTQSMEDLRTLLLVGGNPILNSFTDQAALSLRQEIQTLSWSQREQFPSFASLVDLLAIDASKPFHPAIQLALSSVHNFALFLCHRNSELESSDPADVSTFGFGTGLLAAVAVSCSPEPKQLLPIALEIVLISFRVGLFAAHIRDQISVDKTSPAPWCVRVETEIEKTSLLQQLKEFSSQKHLSTWSRPYVCGESHDSVLVTGIPALLWEFVNTYNLKAASIPVYAPYHGSHIFSENDVELIVNSFPPKLRDAISKCTLLSHIDGKPMPPKILRHLLFIAVKAIVREPLASDDILGSIKDIVLPNIGLPFKIISIGTTWGLELTNMLQDNDGGTNKVQYVDDKTIVHSASASAHPRQEKIAVTGFSGRFPEAENLDSFWDVIHGGIDTHSETPRSRWDVKTHVDPNLKKKNTSGTPFGCWLNNPGLFDRSFFSISPREAPQMDPAQRLALMCAYEAVEMAGLVPDATPSTMRSRVGVFIGCTSNDWCETNSAQDVDFYFIPGGNRAFIPGRINYYFKFCGPSFSIDTACSSSLAAIHLACNALWRKDIDTAIVGGTNVLTNPDVTAGLDRGHFLSRTGNCKTFDDGADGYCRGEGVGIVVLKRLEDAVAENDPIHACILSAGTNHSAEADSITRPHVGAQQALLSQVIASAGVHPNDVSYVEMHGTGTQAGDGREMMSVSQTFAPWPAGDPRGRDSDLYVGSVKANVGHGESVSGVTALIKTMLMMQKNEIPPHCGIKTKINQTFPPDLHDRRIQIAKKPTPWVRTNQPRKVVINNFSAAGGNSCIVIEDAPLCAPGSDRPDTRPAHVVTVSAKSQTALEGNIRSLAQFLRTSDAVSLPDLAYTATARRVHYNFRSSYVAQTIQELSKSLHQDVANPPQRVRGPPKMAFAFSGQGSNHAGMGKYLYDTNATFRMDLNRFDAIVQDQGFGSILPYLQGIGEITAEATPLTVQLAHVSLQMALARLWRSWGVVPAAVIGHSLGEYAALNYAGVLSDFDVLWICGQRAKLLAAHCKAGTHSMLAVRSPQHEVAANLDGIAVEIACINNLRETVVSGVNEDIELSAQKLESNGIRCNRINVPYAFHSSQLQPIMDDFSKVLDGITLRPPTIPIVSPLLSAVVNVDDEIDKDYLLRQCREAVNLVGAVRAAQDASILEDRSHILEIGPSLVLSRLMQRMIEKPLTIIPSLEPNQDSWLVLSRSVASAYRVGCNVNWAQYHRDYSHSVVQLLPYAWDLKNYWLPYVHDWSLRKGEPLPAITASGGSRLQLDTTCCQKVVSADFTGNSVHVIVESDLQSKNLKPVAGGHRVNGIAVCVGSVYAEMAMSVARSILSCFSNNTSNIAILVNDLDMQESLTVSDTLESQVIRISAKCVWERKKVDFQISSGEGQHNKLHCKATVVFGDRKHEQRILRQAMGSTASLIASLKSNVMSGLTERFTMSMAYRMVASLAHYDASHKGVKECFLNSATLEASSLVSLAPQNRLPGVFEAHPCVFDGILSLATFVLNANENSQFGQEVYVVRGWDSVFLDGTLTPDEEYETYVKMTARNNDVSVGDIAVMKGSSLIGSIRGVRVQRVPRRLMDVMFRPKADVRTAPTTSNAISTAKPEIIRETPKPRKTGANPVGIKALTIIAEESGIAPNELKDDDLLANIGIDSLLILVIASRFREELQLDLQPTFFAEISSIGEIKAYVDAQASPPSVASPMDSSVAPCAAPSVVVPSVGNRPEPVDSSKLDTALTIIAEESGISLNELKDDDLLSNIGIDSLLILVIASRFREELDLDLQPTFFAEISSIGEIKSFFTAQDSPPSMHDSNSTTSTSVSPKTLEASAPASSVSDESELSQVQLNGKDQTTALKKAPVRSTSILLQGTLGPNTKTIFMFPDGSGSATSYMNIPRVDPDVAVVAMNCPYMTNPKEMEGSFEDIAKILLAEVRRRQPKGPYYLGGWSAGGAFAYVRNPNIALSWGGGQVARPNRRTMSNWLRQAPSSLLRLLEDHSSTGGIVQDRPLPSWLMDHFQMVNNNLRGFNASPLSRGKSPKTYMVWAAKGTDNLAGFTGRHLLTPEENRDLGFLMDDKTDFGTKGWENLLEGEITIERAMTSNHFTIVRGDGAKILSSLIKRACLTQS